MSADPGRILIVDDAQFARLMLESSLVQKGYATGQAENGRRALERLGAEPWDLVLLDLVMPELDGFGVLTAMKADPRLRHIPVIIISTQDDTACIVRSIELGAVDHLPKFSDPVILHARIRAGLALKRMADQEREHLLEIHAERERSERLLLNILPGPIAARLKDGDTMIVDRIPEVTVLFADFCQFTRIIAGFDPPALISFLNTYFTAFDRLAETFGVEKIKTVGDAYFAVSGLPAFRPDHALAAADLALAMSREMARLNDELGTDYRLRIGLHTGPVIAGVIGERKISYDLWGATVNVASRMESHSLPGEIQFSDATRAHLDDRFAFETRGTIDVKGVGPMRTHFLRHRIGETVSASRPPR